MRNLACVFLTVAAAGAAPAEDWPMYKGDAARTGHLPNTGIARPAIKWHKHFPNANPSAPVVAGGVVYVLAGPTLYGLDAATGAEVFKQGGLAGGERGKAPVPTVFEGAVYLGAGGGLTVLDGRSGKTLWRLDVGGAISSVACADGKAVFTRPSGECVCVDLAGRKVAWTHPAAGQGAGSPAVAGGMVYFTVADKAVAVRLADGSAAWSTPLAKDGPQPGQTPAVADGAVYLVTGHGSIVALDAADGKRKWAASITHEARGNSPIAGLGIVCGGGKGWGVTGLDAAGKKLWRMGEASPIPSLQYPTATNCIVKDGVYVVENYSTMTVYALDARTGVGRWFWRADWRRFGQHPAVAGGMMYYAGSTGYACPEPGGHLFALADESALGTTEDLVRLAGDKTRDVRVRAGAWQGLAHRDPKTACEALAAALGEDNRAATMWACNTLDFYLKGGLAGAPEALGAALVKVLTSRPAAAKGPPVEAATNRIRACAALGGMKYAPAAAALDKAVEGDPDGDVWTAALRALARIQGPAAIPTFERALNSTATPGGISRPVAGWLPAQAADILLSELAGEKVSARTSPAERMAKAKAWIEKNRK